jgi:hypothetical protein
MALTNAERQARYRERLGSKYKRITFTLAAATFKRLRALAEHHAVTQEILLTTLIDDAWGVSKKAGDSQSIERGE